jgi:hypothetical protein
MADNELAKLIAAAIAEANKVSDPEKARLIKRYLRLANESI